MGAPRALDTPVDPGYGVAVMILGFTLSIKRPHLHPDFGEDW
jgi:hypothetical protein